MAIQMMTYDEAVISEVEFVEAPYLGTSDDNGGRMVLLRNSNTQEWLSAHDNEKHVYWSSPKTDPWTWECFRIDEDTKRIGTAHGTHLWYDAETETIWQSPATDDEYADEEGFLYVSEAASDDNVAPMDDTHEPANKKDTKPPANKEDMKAAFNAFCKEQRPDVKSEHPGIKLTEQNKILKDLWNTLDTHTQSQYLP